MASEHARRIARLPCPRRPRWRSRLPVPRRGGRRRRGHGSTSANVDGKKVTSRSADPRVRRQGRSACSTPTARSTARSRRRSTVEEREKKEQADLAREIKRVADQAATIRARPQPVAALSERGGAPQGARQGARRSCACRLQKLEERIAAAEQGAQAARSTRPSSTSARPCRCKLKAALDANDASLEAQKSLVQNQQSEIVRINAHYDVELGAPAQALGRRTAGLARAVARDAAAGAADGDHRRNRPTPGGKTTVK